MATTVQQPEPVAAQATSPPRKRTPDLRGRGHVWKRLVLGPALPTAQLKHERLGKPTALAVFASDNLSSVAYATEEILKVAVPAIGVLAFSVVMPVTYGILGVLAILLFSYRQTIKAYPSAGGAYVVTKDNFGLLTAQLAGVALLTTTCSRSPSPSPQGSPRSPPSPPASTRTASRWPWPSSG